MSRWPWCVATFLLGCVLTAAVLLGLSASLAEPPHEWRD
jgi:hypothetical protein